MLFCLPDLESYHRRLVDTFGDAPHPPAWTWQGSLLVLLGTPPRKREKTRLLNTLFVTEHLRSHEARYRREYNMVARLVPTRRPKAKKYRLHDKRLQSLYKKESRLSDMEFLRQASYLCMATYKRAALTSALDHEADDEDVSAPPPPLDGTVLELDSGEEDAEDAVPTPPHDEQRRQANQRGRGRGRGRAGRGRERGRGANANNVQPEDEHFVAPLALDTAPRWSWAGMKTPQKTPRLLRHRTPGHPVTPY